MNDLTTSYDNIEKIGLEVSKLISYFAKNNPKDKTLPVIILIYMEE